MCKKSEEVKHAAVILFFPPYLGIVQDRLQVELNICEAFSRYGHVHTILPFHSEETTPSRGTGAVHYALDEARCSGVNHRSGCEVRSQFYHGRPALYIYDM